jgi:hypothetical protein
MSCDPAVWTAIGNHIVTPLCVLGAVVAAAWAARAVFS